ncbi:hypothetical protein CKK33_17390 [Mucilaginibacter sp. MD40]|uniref:hypothetical protein n=1 Tax=Mucilaginibacter sp. MD40 TaxID=2029590 RepID=UPI000BD6CE9E|nr:hypothetical protein [Mucilaginibacter sp. MD40]PAW95176.1 hypothetical protein CKK33_17390 [Mucilaginibacter sp. MD40]
MEDSFMSKTQELSLYINTVEVFFKRNFPQLDKDKFWAWFLKMITGREYDINNLANEDMDEILVKLREWEGLLFAPEKDLF